MDLLTAAKGWEYLPGPEWRGFAKRGPSHSRRELTLPSGIQFWVSEDEVLDAAEPGLVGLCQTPDLS
jgi:hypothetical protein